MVADDRSSDCAQGHVEAWFHLGVMHLNGWGTPRNMQQVQYFFGMASKVRPHTHITWVVKFIYAVCKETCVCVSQRELVLKCGAPSHMCSFIRRAVNPSASHCRSRTV